MFDNIQVMLWYRLIDDQVSVCEFKQLNCFFCALIALAVGAGRWITHLRLGLRLERTWICLGTWASECAHQVAVFLDPEDVLSSVHMLLPVGRVAFHV